MEGEGWNEGMEEGGKGNGTEEEGGKKRWCGEVGRRGSIRGSFRKITKGTN